MKRGIVMKVRRNKAIVMTNDGAFEQVRLSRNQAAQIGQEILIPEQSGQRGLNFTFPVFPAVAAAALAIMLFFVGIIPSQQTDAAVAAYVSVDVNPSVEVGVNRTLEILEVAALNKDGELVAGHLTHIKGQSLSEFLEAYLAEADKQGYLTENHDVLIASVIEDGKEYNEIEEMLEQELTAAKVNLSEKDNTLVINTINVDQKTRKDANENGLSTGKYVAYQKAVKDGQKLTVDEVKEMSVTALNQRTTKVTNSKGNKVNGSIKHVEKRPTDEANIHAPGQVKKANEAGIAQNEKQPPGQLKKSVTEEEQNINKNSSTDQKKNKADKKAAKQKEDSDDDKDESDKKNDNHKNGHDKHTKKD